MHQVSEYRLNLNTWYSDRELRFLPKHFVVSKTPITHESKQWILENLHGRFCVVNYIDINSDDNDFRNNLFLPSDYPAFEDPKEAILYELKFS